ncbi:MAG: two-component system, OmpR family, response regulator [Frankiaceae bacterium]|nr:two-component system, OmpR family, response regulator [Frankiaceae bacterium]
MVNVKLLIVEDDPKIARALERGLTAEGFTVTVARDGDEGLWRATESAYDGILLDLMLPGRDGLAICRDLRARGVWTPVLVVTAKDSIGDQTTALNDGADDFLTKPFTFAVLLARLRAVLRRAAVTGPAPTQLGSLHLDSGRRRASAHGRPLILTSREFDVLEYLTRRCDRVLSKTDLLDGVWDADFSGDPNIVEVYVSRLRRKLAASSTGVTIATERGAGYRLLADEA